jgi:hypothetical protein
VEPGTVLRAVLSHMPDGTPETIPEPLIPLLDTTLLTNAPGEPRVGNQLLTERRPRKEATVFRSLAGSTIGSPPSFASGTRLTSIDSRPSSTSASTTGSICATFRGTVDVATTLKHCQICSLQTTSGPNKYFRRSLHASTILERCGPSAFA